MNKFQIHIPSGRIVAIDPMYVDSAVNPRGDVTPILQRDEYLNAEGIDKLIALEMAAMGSTRTREILRTIAFIDITPCVAGVYSFRLKDIVRMEYDEAADPTEEFSLDSGQVLVFDFRYLDGVLEHFRWKGAYKHDVVDRDLERKHGQLIANRDDVYVQIQSPGIGQGVEFVGDGEYSFRKNAFKLLSEDADRE